MDDIDYSLYNVKPVNKSNIDYSSYNPKSKSSEIHASENISLSDIFKNPGLFKKELMRQQQERTAGGKRGFQDIGEMGKQLFTGIAHPENYADLTKKIDAERAAYMQSPEGQNPAIQANRQFVSHLPSAALLIPGLSAGSLPAMIGTGAALGGLGSQLQYTPEGESRGANAVEGALLGGAIPAASGAAGALSKIMKTLLYKTSPQKTASFIQEGHDALRKQAKDLYSNVQNEVEKRGMSKLPIPDKLIEETERFFPKTEASKNLINKAKTGDFESIRKLQSDLRKRAEKFKSADLSAEWDKGDEAFDLRDKLNEEVANSLNLFGHNDLSNKLSEANKIYKDLKETYYSHPTISKLVEPTLRKVPKSINSIVGEISKPMERIRQAHPELEKEINAVKEKEQAMGLLKKAGWLGTGALGFYEGQKALGFLKNLLENK